ncbi:uncharacterized oxidoreductase SERP2049 [Papilio machaon]|uniref:uncharacterized oxidoreductase SERP2049 n=1 Tax=Papilio machaon TaxID=76193 RepID=UPI001E664F0C|nr:uncharacterized oxidoreductase SERP2049 [Papilio machaon]
MSFNNKVVLVTGASKGIGAAISIKFSTEKASVILISRNEEKLQEVAQKCKDVGGNPLVVAADLTVDDDVERAIKTSIEHFGRLDVLINNAGFAASESILSKNALKVFDNIMALNLRAHVLVTHLTAPYLIDTKGCIINISSIASTGICFRINSQYSTSKAGLDAFTRSIAIELAPYGVRVNSVNPGPVKSEFMERMGLNEEQKKQLWDTLVKGTALNNIIEPCEVGDLVLFLSSDKAKSITGSSYVIDSGVLLKGMIDA